MAIKHKDGCGNIAEVESYIISSYSGLPVPVYKDGYHKIGAGIDTGKPNHTKGIVMNERSIPKHSTKKKS